MAKWCGLRPRSCVFVTMVALVVVGMLSGAMVVWRKPLGRAARRARLQTLATARRGAPPPWAAATKAATAATARQGTGGGQWTGGANLYSGGAKEASGTPFKPCGAVTQRSVGEAQARAEEAHTLVWEPVGTFPKLEMPPPPPPLCHAFDSVNARANAEYWRGRLDEAAPLLAAHYGELLAPGAGGAGSRFEAAPDVFQNTRCWRDTKSPEEEHKDDKVHHCLPMTMMVGFLKCGSAELSKLIQDVYGQHSGAQHVKTFVSATPGTSYLRTDGPVNVDLLAIAESFDDEVQHRLRTPQEGLGVGGGVKPWVGDFTARSLKPLRDFTVKPPATFPLDKFDRNPEETLPLGLLIRHLMPELRFFATVRDPVDMTYSVFRQSMANHIKRDWASEEDVPFEFHDTVVDALTGMARCMNVHPEDPSWYWDCIGATKHAIGEGVFAYQLAWFMDVIGAREATLVSRAEDLTPQGARQVLEAWGEHTGIKFDKKLVEAKLAQLTQTLQGASPVDGHRTKHTKVNENEKLTEPMLPETRALLEEFFAPHNMLLARLLGNDAFQYTYQHGSGQLRGPSALVDGENE